MCTKLKVGCLACLTLGWGIAIAAPAIPDSAIPSRVEQQIPKVSAHTDKSDDQTESIKAGNAGSTDPALTQVKIYLKGVQLKNAKTQAVAFNAALQKIAKPFLNQSVTLEQVQAIGFALQKLYQDEGYILTQVVLPPQDIHKDAANVIYEVVEGYVAQIMIKPEEDAPYSVQVQRYADLITESRPLQVTVLERSLLQINDLPGVAAQSVLAPSPTVVGAANMNLNVRHTPAMVYAGYSNRGTTFLGPRQMQAGFQLNSLLAADRLSVNTSTVMPFPRQLVYYDVDYRVYVGDAGWQLHGIQSHTRSKPGGSLVNLKLSGYSKKTQFDVTYPWWRSRFKNLNFSAGLYFLDSENDTRLDPAQSQKLYKDNIRGVFASGNWSFTSPEMVTHQVMVKVTRGMPWFQASRDDDTVPHSRQGGHAEFTKLDLEINRTRYWTEKLSYMLGVQGAWGLRGLLASEQYGYGGAQYGSAYDSSTLTGDRGFSVRWEGRYDLAQNAGSALISWAQLYAGVDHGRTWVLDTVNQVSGGDAASAFFGVRTQLFAQIDASCEFAKPLTFPVTIGDDVSYHPRVFFNILSRL